MTVLQLFGVALVSNRLK